MIQLNIKTTDSVNGIYFALPRDMCRNLFKLPYKENPGKQYLKDPDWADIAKDMMEIMASIKGVSYEKFVAGVPDIQDNIYDSYEGFHVFYNKDFQFEAIELYNSGSKVNFTVDGIDCSDFKINTLLSLADDFVYDEKDTTWESQSKSIRIWCPNGKNNVEAVLFGHDEYFDD